MTEASEIGLCQSDVLRTACFRMAKTFSLATNFSCLILANTIFFHKMDFLIKFNLSIEKQENSTSKEQEKKLQDDHAKRPHATDKICSTRSSKSSMTGY